MMIPLKVNRRGPICPLHGSCHMYMFWHVQSRNHTMATAVGICATVVSGAKILVWDRLRKVPDMTNLAEHFDVCGCRHHIGGHGPKSDRPTDSLFKSLSGYNRKDYVAQALRWSVADCATVPPWVGQSRLQKNCPKSRTNLIQDTVHPTLDTTVVPCMYSCSYSGGAQEVVQGGGAKGDTATASVPCDYHCSYLSECLTSTRSDLERTTVTSLLALKQNIDEECFSYRPPKAWINQHWVKQYNEEHGSYNAWIN